VVNPLSLTLCCNCELLRVDKQEIIVSTIVRGRLGTKCGACKAIEKRVPRA
jgi:uncharacterized cysteine cluster protein YcgN (CxxCxxCC family)